MYPFYVYSWVRFDRCIYLYNHGPNWDLERFHLPTKFSPAPGKSVPWPQPPLVCFLSFEGTSASPKRPVNWIIQYGPSLSLVCFRHHNVGEVRSCSFLFFLSSVPWHEYIPVYLFTYQCSLGYLLIWPILTIAARHILVQILETFLKVYFYGKIRISIVLAICKWMIQWHETHQSCVNVCWTHN